MKTIKEINEAKKGFVNDAEDLPRGWNDKLEAVYKEQTNDYLEGFTDYRPTREEILKNTKEEFNRLKNLLKQTITL